MERVSAHQESLGLTPIEGMAAGCLVAGYHGYGGLEYATAQNGLAYSSIMIWTSSRPLWTRSCFDLAQRSCRSRSFLESYLAMLRSFGTHSSENTHVCVTCLGSE